MAGRRGVGGGRMDLRDFRNSTCGRGEGWGFVPSTFPTNSAECEEGFGVGFVEEGFGEGIGDCFLADEEGNWASGLGSEGDSSQARGFHEVAGSRGRRPGVPEASFEEAYPRRQRIGRGRGRRVGVVPAALGRGSHCPPGTPSNRNGTCSATAAATAATAALASGSHAGGSDGGPVITTPSEELRRGVQRGATSSQGQSEQEGTVSDISGSRHQRKEKTPKGKNFTAEEERQLARSVVCISQDPITGNAQKGSAYWERIYRHYNERRPLEFRPLRSLETKWSTIKHDVSKFIAILQQCTNLSASGTNATNVQRKALELYQLKSPKNTEFTYLHMWEIVKEIPRWNSLFAQERTPTPTLKRKQAPSNSQATAVPASISNDGGAGSTSEFSRARPQGAKRAKEDRRLLSSADATARAQAIATKAMADATLKKMQVMHDQNVFMLMTHAGNGVLSTSATTYLALQEEEELENLRARMAESRARRENTRHPPPSPIPVETPEALQERVNAALQRVRASPPQLRHTLSNKDGIEQLREGSAAHGGNAYIHYRRMTAESNYEVGHDNNIDDFVQTTELRNVQTYPSSQYPEASEPGFVDFNFDGDGEVAAQDGYISETDDEEYHDITAEENHYSSHVLESQEFEESPRCSLPCNGTFDLNSSL